MCGAKFRIKNDEIYSFDFKGAFLFSGTETVFSFSALGPATHCSCRRLLRRNLSFSLKKTLKRHKTILSCLLSVAYLIREKIPGRTGSCVRFAAVLFYSQGVVWCHFLSQSQKCFFEGRQVANEMYAPAQ